MVRKAIISTKEEYMTSKKATKELNMTSKQLTTIKCIYLMKSE